MLPYQHNNDDLWTRDALLDACDLASDAAGLKKLERLTSDAQYFPPLIDATEVTDEDSHPVQKNLMQAELNMIKSRRGKYVIVQLWQPDHRPVMICAHDGRSARIWNFANKNQSQKDALQDFIHMLADKITQPLLLCLHAELSAFRHELIIPKPLQIAVMAYHEQYDIAIDDRLVPSKPATPLSHLDRLEAESFEIMREVVAETTNPVMLYSIGKDSAVMLHLARKAFWPAVPPFPLLHVDTGWKFQAMYEFRDQIVEKTGMTLLVHKNPDGVKQGINPFDHGSALHTDIMKTQGLKQALDHYQFDAAFGGARRDEEKSRAKERVFSFRTANHQWNPKDQRPELWNVYNTRVAKSESIRVFPLSNWTELDIWTYIYREQIPIVPLYFSAPRPVIKRDGTIIMVDDDRLVLGKSEKVEMKMVRFRTLGCYPLTGAVESQANNIEDIILELLTARTSERQGRTIDKDAHASMEAKKKEGYF
jgi:sulfate adenylyltransferase subunit 2